MRYTMCYSLIYIKGLRTILRANTLPQSFQNLIKRIEFLFWHPSNEDFVNITWVDKKVHVLIRFRFGLQYEIVFAFIQSTLRIMCTYYMQYITTIITYGHRFSKIVNGEQLCTVHAASKIDLQEFFLWFFNIWCL